MFDRGRGLAAAGGLQGLVADRVRPLDGSYDAAVASSRMDVGSNLPLAPTSCGTLSEATSQPHKKARHQVVEYTARGAASGALAAAATEALEVDMHAATAIGPRRSLLNTGTKYHLEWFGEAVDPFLLNEEILIVVAAMFKGGEYPSFPQYLSRAKEEHIRRGHMWSHLLGWTSRQCNRSATRGFGRDRQSEGLVRDVTEVDGGFSFFIFHVPKNVFL